MAQQRIAILYTGAARTMRDVLPYFVENVLLHSNVHVFAVLQRTESSAEDEQLVRTHMREHLKSFQTLDREDEAWVTIREQLLVPFASNGEMLTVGGQPTLAFDYLRDSGSMLEYYQMHLAYQQMVTFEQEQKDENLPGEGAEEPPWRYDFVVRIRTDCLITRPLRVAVHRQATIEEIITGLRIARGCMPDDPFCNPGGRRGCQWMQESPFSARVLQHCISGLLDRARAPHICSVGMSITPSPAFMDLTLATSDLDCATRVQRYLQAGKFVLTLRDNVIYVLPRSAASDEISKLGFTYGQWRLQDVSKCIFGHWWNAEGQFKGICLASGLDVIDSLTPLESKSICRSKYESSDYFLLDNGTTTTPVLMQRADVLFFLKRT